MKERKNSSFFLPHVVYNIKVIRALLHIVQCTIARRHAPLCESSQPREQWMTTKRPSTATAAAASLGRRLLLQYTHTHTHTHTQTEISCCILVDRTAAAAAAVHLRQAGPRCHADAPYPAFDPLRRRRFVAKRRDGGRR